MKNKVNDAFEITTSDAKDTKNSNEKSKIK